MAVSTWYWLGTTNDPTIAGNWGLLSGPGNAAQLPQAGDTEIAQAGMIVMPNDSHLVGTRILIGGTSGAAGVSFIGDNALSLAAPSLDSLSLISSTVPGAATPAQTILNVAGTFINTGTIFANGPAGSSFALNVQPGTAGAAGYFINSGSIIVTAGNTLTIAIAAGSEMSNSGRITVAGGTLVIGVTGGVYAPTAGLVIIKAGGTLETNANYVAFGNAGVVPTYLFADALAGNTLKIDTIGGFGGRILGFGVNDTIDLGTLLAVGKLVYSKTSGVLTLQSSLGVNLASLSLGSGNFQTGTFAVTGGVADGFTIVTGADGNTVLTTAIANDGYTNTSGVWQTAGNWANGTPGAADTALLGVGASAAFTLTTGGTPVTVSALDIANAFSTLQVTSNTIVGPYGITALGGTIDVTSGNTLSAAQIVMLAGSLQVDPGATLNLTGHVATAIGANTGSLAVVTGNSIALVLSGGSLLVNGGVLNAGTGQVGGNGGRIAIGVDGNGAAAITVQNTGTIAGIGAGTGAATYTALGSTATSSGTLTLNGNVAFPNLTGSVVWTDQIDPTDTLTTRGYMLVGVDAQPFTPGSTTQPASTAASLVVENGATLTEQSFAEIGVAVDSIGNAQVLGGQWNIGLVNGGFLDVGLAGAGSLTVGSFGTVAVGNGGTFSNNGTAFSGSGIIVGLSATATGVLTIGGLGALVTDGGGLTIGHSGTVIVDSGGNLQVTQKLLENATGSTLRLTGGSAAFATASGLAGANIVTGSTIDLESGGLLFGIGTVSAQSGNIGIVAGTTLSVSAGAIGASAIIIDNAAGGMLVNAGIVQAVTAGASLEIQANVSGAGTESVAGTGYIKFDGTVAVGNAVKFNGTASAGTIELGAPGAFLGTLSNFYGTGNQIILDNTGMSAPSLAWLPGAPGNGSLVVRANGTVVASLSFTGSFPAGFNLVSDPAVNGLIISAATSAASPFTETGAGRALGQMAAGGNILQGTAGTISLTAAAGTAVNLLDGASVVATGTANGAGIVSFDASGLALGSHFLTASVVGGGTTLASAVPLTIAGATQAQFVLTGSTAKLVGGSGSSTVYVNTTGQSSITLGDGNDAIFAAGAALNVSLGNGINVVLGGNNNDVVNAGTGGNSIYLGNGTDTVTAGDGANHVIVGGGANSVTLGNGKNEIEAGAGVNTITVGNGNNYVQAGNGNNIVTSGTGTSGIQLGDGANQVYAGAGADTIILGNGNNFVSLASGMHFLRVGGGNNTITATTGNETIDLHGGGNNHITAGNGANLIYGGGNDTIILGDGNNVVSMTDGSDTITEGNGNDAVTLYSSSSASTVTLGNGTNTVISGGGGATITLGSGNNYVEALGGNNTITVGNGNNVVKGDSGNDVFNVGKGYVHGNGPTDIFNLGAGGGGAYGGWGLNSLNINAGAWFVAAAFGSDRIDLTGSGAFAYLEFFDITKDMLVLSNAAFGLGATGLTGTATQAIGAMLSSATDGSFTGNSLVAYNASTGVLFDRANTSSGGVAVALFANDPGNITARLVIGV